MIAASELSTTVILNEGTRVGIINSISSAPFGSFTYNFQNIDLYWSREDENEVKMNPRHRSYESQL